MRYALSRRSNLALTYLLLSVLPAHAQAPSAPPAKPAAASSPAATSPAAPTSAPAAPTTAPKGEAEFLASPGGGAFEVPIHLGTVCILTFPEKLFPSGIASSPDFEIMQWGNDGMAVRAKSRATTTTVALSTISGSIKANLTIRVVPETEPALTLVRLRAVTDEEAFQGRVARELEKQMAPLRAQIAAERAAIEESIRERAEATLAERLLRRVDVVSIGAHERNAEAVIVHVRRAVIAGEDAYLFFDIENRSRAAYRLAKVSVKGPDGNDRSGVVKLTTGASKDPKVLGSVPAGTSARVVVAVRGAEALKGKSLKLSIEEPSGRGRIELSRGVEL